MVDFPFSVVGFFILGLGVAATAGNFVSKWAKNAGNAAFASGMARGMRSKLLSEEDLSRIRSTETLPRLQASRFWEKVQTAQDRMDFEMELEDLAQATWRKLARHAPEPAAEFTNAYYTNKAHVRDVKLVLSAIANKRDVRELSGLLLRDGSPPHKTREALLLDQLLSAKDAGEVINILKNTGVGRQVSYALYQEFGFEGITLALDRQFYHMLKLRSRGKADLSKIFRALHDHHIYKSVLHLKCRGHDAKKIIRLLAIRSDAHKRLAETDLNVLVRDLTRKSPRLQRELLLGRDFYELIDEALEDELLKRVSAVKLSNPRNAGIIFETGLRAEREAQRMKDLWWVREAASGKREAMGGETQEVSTISGE